MDFQRGRIAAFCALLLLGLAGAPAIAQNAYIANSGSGTLSVINTATKTVSATIPVGRSPFGVAVSPDGGRVYVTKSELPDTVWAVDAATNAVISTIPVGPGPFGVAVTPNGGKVYVSGINNVTVIDATTNRVTATIPVDTYLLGVAVTPDGGKAYFAGGGDSSVWVVDTATDRVLTRIVLPGDFASAWAVAAHPDGRKIYVTSGDLSNKVWIIDTATNTVSGSISVGAAPLGIAVSHAGKLYVTNNASGDVSVIDTANNRVIATIPVEATPYGVSVTPDGREVYVTNPSVDKVCVINAATNTVSARIPVGDTPVSLGLFIRPTVPFQSFYADLRIGPATKRNNASFKLDSSFTLNSWTSNGINPARETVALRIGAFAVTIPPGSFVARGQGQFAFDGNVGGFRLRAVFKPGAMRYGGRPLDYTFTVDAREVGMGGARNAVTLMIGNDAGRAATNARLLASLSVD